MDINKKIKDLEKELKELKKKAKEEVVKETTTDRSEEMKGKDHKMRLTLKDELSNDVLFDGYIKGAIISAISEENPDETIATAYTKCDAKDIYHLLTGSEKVCDELRTKVCKSMTRDLFNGLKDLLEGDDDNE